MILFSIEEFTARRRKKQDEQIEQMLPWATAWIADLEDANAEDDLRSEAAVVYRDIFASEGGTGDIDEQVEKFLASLDDVFAHTTSESRPLTLATLLVVAAQNAATIEATSRDEEFLVLEWVTMHDDDVRATHKETEGQQRPPGEPFDVGGTEMPYPGYPGVEPSLWINCRCSLAPAQPNEFTKVGVVMTATETEQEVTRMTALPWHGVLAPEGEMSGDKRMFAPNSLTFRDLPLPLTWQKTSAEGHSGSVTVAKIDHIERVDGEMRGSGTFLASVEADEVVGLIAEFGRFGVSVDADSAEFDYDEDEGSQVFTAARIASASIVPIPAFSQAWVALGEAPEGFLPSFRAETEDVAASPTFIVTAAGGAGGGYYLTNTTNEFISDKSWDGSASRFTDEQWKRSCVMHVCDGMEKKCHKLPIREPGGALSRAGVHAAASRFNQVDGPAEAKASAKRALRGAYRQLGEEVPDNLQAAESEAEEFGRGPGWITDPVATKRIHDYWTRPGEEGYAKIGWGKGGDFNRCRLLVGEKIATNSPEDLRFLNQICAQWHHDALGIWPGEHLGDRNTEEFVATSVKLGLPIHELDETPAQPLTLVASGGFCAPSEWFKDPEFDKPTHLTVTPEGQVYGHIAEWGTCHIGPQGMCITAPPSPSNYAYFATGTVLLDDGTEARTGPITIGGGHAERRLRHRGAVEHYDRTCNAVADVAVGEDKFGIWCAGWVRPGTTDEQVTALRASDVSGDWRKIGGQMEMVAALGVNTGGFHVPVQVAAANGEQISLVAAGVVHGEPQEVDVNQLADAIAAAIDRRAKEAVVREAKKKELAARLSEGSE